MKKYIATTLTPQPGPRLRPSGFRAVASRPATPLPPPREPADTLEDLDAGDDDAVPEEVEPPTVSVPVDLGAILRAISADGLPTPLDTYDPAADPPTEPPPPPDPEPSWSPPAAMPPRLTLSPVHIPPLPPFRPHAFPISQPPTRGQWTTSPSAVRRAFVTVRRAPPPPQPPQRWRGWLVVVVVAVACLVIFGYGILLASSR